MKTPADHCAGGAVACHGIRLSEGLQELTPWRYRPSNVFMLIFILHFLIIFMGSKPGRMLGDDMRLAYHFCRPCLIGLSCGVYGKCVDFLWPSSFGVYVYIRSMANPLKLRQVMLAYCCSLVCQVEESDRDQARVPGLLRSSRADRRCWPPPAKMYYLDFRRACQPYPAY